MPSDGEDSTNGRRGRDRRRDNTHVSVLPVEHPLAADHAADLPVGQYERGNADRQYKYAAVRHVPKPISIVQGRRQPAKALGQSVGGDAVAPTENRLPSPLFPQGLGQGGREAGRRAEVGPRQKHEIPK